MAFCSNQENRHIRGVHYLEHAPVLNIIMKLQVTLDGFNIVKTKYGMNYIVVVCCFAADRSSIAQ